MTLDLPSDFFPHCVHKGAFISAMRFSRRDRRPASGAGALDQQQFLRGPAFLPGGGLGDLLGTIALRNGKSVGRQGESPESRSSNWATHYAPLPAGVVVQVV